MVKLPPGILKQVYGGTAKQAIRSADVCAVIWYGFKSQLHMFSVTSTPDAKF